MLKKVLLFGGLAGIGFSFFYYFKKQLALALDLNYKLKSFRLVELTPTQAKIKTQIEVRNKSNFNLKIDGYDLTFNFKNIPVARSASNVPIMVQADRNFILDADGTIDLKKVSQSILPFVNDVIKKRPIKLQLSGYINVNFLNINHKVNLDGKEVEYSSNLLAEIGLEDEYDKAINKLDEILGKVGIKI